MPQTFYKMRKFVQQLMVLENTASNSTNHLIKLKSDAELIKIEPGQFVNVEINGTDQVFLRRPFSIFEVDYKEKTISLLVKILGKGSKKLTEIKVGEKVSIIFPLGKGFTPPGADERILLIGGGSGVAPMLFLARESGLPKNKVDILLGAKTSEDHINAREYEKYGDLHFSTDDGTKGERGFVTQHPIFVNNISQYNKIYTCGPNGMMKAVAEGAKKANVFCEVSLENLMACGFGVCLCCIEPTTKGNLCVCTEGPVFNINDLKWEI